MPTVNLSPIANDAPFVDASGNPLSGGLLYTYTAGSSTPETTYTTQGGSTANANPVVLNANGYPASAGSVVEIWLTAGVEYKFTLKTSAGVEVWTRDDISGINDPTAFSAAGDQWVASGLTPTYISATSFSVTGDQTAVFQANRRMKSANTAGTIYSRIKSSSFGAVTTVTVVNDSGTLDSGMSTVSLGVVTPINGSMPVLIDTYPVVSGSSDKTKLVRIEADGLTTDTTRDIIMPDHNVFLGGDMTPKNISLVAAVAANALTFSLKTFAGTDPSATDPALIPFKSTTSSSGDMNTMVITSAQSITVSSGSTLGTLNALPFRVWVVAFNDQGTFRMGVVQCVTPGAAAVSNQRPVTAVFSLADCYISNSSTAEGGAGGADTAGVIYTGTAVSNMPMIVLGYADWTGGLATAGAWASGPTHLVPYVSGMALPGQRLGYAVTRNGVVQTGTTVVPLDDTIPTITEGDPYFVLPTAGYSTPPFCAFCLSAKVFMATSAAATVIATICDASAAIAVGAVRQPNTGVLTEVSVSFCGLIAASVGGGTFTVRAGPSAAATVTVNGVAAGRLFGGVMDSYFEIVVLQV